MTTLPADLLSRTYSATPSLGPEHIEMLNLIAMDADTPVHGEAPTRTTDAMTFARNVASSDTSRTILTELQDMGLVHIARCSPDEISVVMMTDEGFRVWEGLFTHRIDSGQVCFDADLNRFLSGRMVFDEPEFERALVLTIEQTKSFKAFWPKATTLSLSLLRDQRDRRKRREAIKDRLETVTTIHAKLEECLFLTNVTGVNLSENCIERLRSVREEVESVLDSLEDDARTEGLSPEAIR